MTKQACLEKREHGDICRHCGLVLRWLKVSRGEVIVLGLCADCVNDPKINPCLDGWRGSDE
ncbi:hypothetical protein [Candidatus Bathycorpusculum sp.]|uniref:hypothetical protein n=1 Tax=Candidatus Bathycorpusculum sp. TaxID=2994959 RepID=UPI002824FA8F|nr:hypothetical protein [Candidatus Termitimicrobium sp.]MCL2432656.1 hypothetical protein [Candidatus Termitimicrobium sp.]